MPFIPRLPVFELWSACFVAFVCVTGPVVGAEPLLKAHAHNDYAHKRPLLDALDHGFCSVEADVFAIDGELRVAHFRLMTRKGQTLKKIYLEPLSELCKKNGGFIQTDRAPFTLLIDFKTGGEETYSLLSKRLAEYPHLFAKPRGAEFAPVQAVISGERPIELIKADQDRLCGIDGRLDDLDSKLPVELLPLISDNWRTHFKWRGTGDVPSDERKKLEKIVAKCHKAGRRLRFWATPETEEMWRLLSDVGVDHINTDRLVELQEFLSP